jgi:hypothetical protein
VAFYYILYQSRVAAWGIPDLPGGVGTSNIRLFGREVVDDAILPGFDVQQNLLRRFANDFH